MNLQVQEKPGRAAKMQLHHRSPFRFLNSTLHDRLSLHYNISNPSSLLLSLRYAVAITQTAEFDEVADSFRDPRVWAKDASGAWVKDSIRAFDGRRGA